MWGEASFVKLVDTTNAEISPTVRSPRRSNVTRGGDHPKRTRSKQVPSHDEMRSRMRVRRLLKMGLEPDIVSRKRVHGGIHDLSRERRVDQQHGVLIRYAWKLSCEERLKGVIAADVVRDGVGNFEVLKSTGGDLEVVLWVTPRAETVVSGVGPDRCVVKVRGIYFCIRTGTQQSLPKALPCVQSQ